MDFVSFIQGLLFSIATSGLIGVEREHARKLSKSHAPIFGIRTTMLFGMLGFLCSYISILLDFSPILIIGIVLSIVVTTTVYVSNAFVHKHTGATTYITMFIVFLMGTFVGIGGYVNYLIAASLSIIVTAILAAKRKMVSWTRKLTSEEILAAVKFGILAVIILPLLPNKYIGIYHIINPFEIWYIVVFISLIYFISYILMKLYSHKGLLVSSFFSGLISSSPTVYQLSDWARRKKELLNDVKAGVFIACFACLLSHLLIISLVFHNIPLTITLLPPYIVGMSSLLFFAFINYKGKHKFTKPININSPFAVKPALTFGAIYTVLVFVGGVLNIYFGHLGLLPITFAGSLISSSTVISSLADLATIGKLSSSAASIYIVFSAVIALLIKVFWVHHARNKELLKKTLFGVFVTSLLMVATLYLEFITL